MPRLIILYDLPPDPDAFDTHYRDVHMPIVRRYPNLRDVRLTTPQGVAGRPAPFHLMTEMVFDSDEDLEAALSSDAAAASAKDLRNFAQSGASVFIAPDEADA